MFKRSLAVFRRIPKTTIVQATWTRPIVARNFASFEQIEKSSQKLVRALESEIKYEKENYSQLEDIENFLD